MKEIPGRMVHASPSLSPGSSRPAPNPSDQHPSTKKEIPGRMVHASPSLSPGGSRPAPNPSGAQKAHSPRKPSVPALRRRLQRRETDLPTIEEFLRFVQGVFDELNARYTDQEETAPTAKLTSKSIEVPLILAFCRQHPSPYYAAL
jgi:hypothetical protein